MPSYALYGSELRINVGLGTVETFYPDLSYRTGIKPVFGA